MSKIAVWFSCGVASAVAAKYTIEDYPNDEIRVLNNPVKEEDEDNLRFLKDVERWINHPIELVYSKKYPSSSAQEVWKDRKFMSGPKGAPCTIELKKKARQEWEEINKPDWHVLGFTFDEKKRHERFILTERDNLLPVLIDRKTTKQDCFKILAEAGIKPPRVYSLGFPNANCIGCVKATSPTYWNLVRETFPAAFKERCDLSKKLGVKLTRVKGERIYLDELKETDVGAPLKQFDLECGVFCEEHDYNR